MSDFYLVVWNFLFVPLIIDERVDDNVTLRISSFYDLMWRENIQLL